MVGSASRFWPILSYSIISPYFVRVDPIPTDGYFVEEIDGDIGRSTCIFWIDEHYLLVCEVDLGAIVLHKLDSKKLTKVIKP